MKLFLLILLASFSTKSFAQTVINDKNAELRDVSAFSGIKVSGGMEVYLSQGDDYALAVSANEDKFRDNIKTKIINGILNIYYDGGSLTFNEKRNLRVYISFKTLQSIEASGATNIIINGGLKSSDLKLEFSGASEMRGTVNISNLLLKMSGASTMKIDGRIENFRVEASGASDLKNYDLAAGNCIIKISGASDMKLTINKSLTINASGASTLRYKGNPENKQVNVSGASSVSQAN